MKGEAYERYISQLYRENGFNTTLTSRTNDRGIDIIAEKEGYCIAIQCKHYTGRSKVSSPDVQQASGLLTRADIHEVHVVTTGRFTREARSIANKRGVNLQQIGFNPSRSNGDDSTESSDTSTDDDSTDTSTDSEEVTWESIIKNIKEEDISNTEKAFSVLLILTWIILLFRYGIFKGGIFWFGISVMLFSLRYMYNNAFS